MSIACQSCLLIKQVPISCEPRDSGQLYDGKEGLRQGVSWQRVSWQRVIRDIIKAGYTLESIAKESGICAICLHRLLTHHSSGLNFRQGARLLQLHRVLCPEIVKHY